MPTSKTSYRGLFQVLLRDYQALLGYASPTLLPDEGAVSFGGRWGGIAFELHHSPITSPQALFIRCLMGPPPPEHAESVMRRLLSLQRAIAPGLAGALSLEPRTGDVCFTRALPLDGLTGAELLDALGKMRTWAANWRDTYFKDEAGGARPAAMAALC